MGVLRKSYSSGAACLASDNVDTERCTRHPKPPPVRAEGLACMPNVVVGLGACKARLHQMVREITTEMGLPASTELYETNPVQLFDFSRRARCIDPVRVLSSAPAPSTDGSQQLAVLAPAEFLTGPGAGADSVEGGHGSVHALVLPVGDALQEPVWTQGLGINRGFHTAMNQAYACLLAREGPQPAGTGSLAAAVRESCAVHEGVAKMRWGAGHSGLAGSGSGALGLKPFKEWNADPRSRLPIK